MCKRKLSGQTVIGSARPRRQPASPVLILLEPSGFVRVYGEREKVSVCIVNMLDVSDRSRIDAEEYLEHQLPRRFRSVFWPVNLLAMGSIKDCLTVDAEEQRLADLHLLRSIREWNPAATTQ